MKNFTEVIEDGAGRKIQGVRESCYGMFEWDLLDGSGNYVGLLLGTETRNGVIWEIQRWRDGRPDGSVARLAATSKIDALTTALSFCS